MMSFARVIWTGIEEWNGGITNSDLIIMVNTAAVSIVVVFMQVAQVTEEDKRLAEEGGEDDEPPVGIDFITFMMHAGKMDLETIATNAVDLMGGGVDTVRPT